MPGDFGQSGDGRQNGYVSSAPFGLPQRAESFLGITGITGSDKQGLGADKLGDIITAADYQRLAGRRLTLTIRQKQPPAWGTFRMPGLVLVLDGCRVPVNVNGPETTVLVENVRAVAREIVVDPDLWWLVELAPVPAR